MIYISGIKNSYTPFLGYVIIIELSRGGFAMRYIVRKALNLVSANNENNFMILSKYFGENGIEKNDYLFILTNEIYDEEKCLKAIKSIIYITYSNGIV